MKRILFLSSCTYLLDQLEPRISLEEIWWSPDGLSTQKIKKKKKKQKKKNRLTDDQYHGYHLNIATSFLLVENDYMPSQRLLLLFIGLT